MKANQLLRAARHARASGAPIETVAEDKSVGQQMTPAAVPFPSEGALPSLGSTTAWLNALHPVDQILGCGVWSQWRQCECYCAWGSWPTLVNQVINELLR